MKRDVLNLDIAGFKASINNTNTTQNKQLQTLFEGIDALKKEACQHTLTGQFSYSFSKIFSCKSFYLYGKLFTVSIKMTSYWPIVGQLKCILAYHC